MRVLFNLILSCSHRKVNSENLINLSDNLRNSSDIKAQFNTIELINCDELDELASQCPIH